MFRDISKPVYSLLVTNWSKWFCFCRVWIRLINLHLLSLRKCDKSKHLPWIWCLPNALCPGGFGHWTHQNSVCMHWICLIFLCLPNAQGPGGLRHWTHQNSVHVHWICIISLAKKVNVYLLTPLIYSLYNFKLASDVDVHFLNTPQIYTGDPRPPIPPCVMASSAMELKLVVFGFLQTQTHYKCVHDLCALCRVLHMFNFTLRPQ